MKNDALIPDCERLDAALDEWMAGRLAADVVERLEAHAARCDRCRRLVSIVRGWGDEDEEVPDLLPRVIARTSGAACGRAEQQLPALVDGGLDDNAREVLQQHVSHCENCARLLRVLEEARHTLPALREIEPPDGFTAQVLARTSGRSRRTALAEWWLRLLARPRASLELAYVGTLLIVVLVGNPMAAVQGIGEQANRLKARAPQLAGELTASGTATRTLSSAEQVLDWLTATADRIIGGVRLRWDQARSLAAAVARNVRVAFDWVTSLDIRRVLGLRGVPAQERSQPPPAAPLDRSR